MTPEPLDLTKQAIANIFKPTPGNVILAPSGQWAAAMDFCSIRILDINLSKEWEVSCAQIYPSEVFFDPDFIQLILGHWSMDGIYAYFYPQLHTDGFGSIGTKGWALFRVNLATGQLSEILPLGASYDFSFSFNEEYLVYVKKTTITPIVIVARNLITEKETIFTLADKYMVAGETISSPFKNQFLIFAGTGELGMFSLYLLDVDNMVLGDILLDQPDMYIPRKWVEEDLVLVWRRDNRSGESEELYLNLLTREFSPAPTTTLGP